MSATASEARASSPTPGPPAGGGRLADLAPAFALFLVTAVVLVVLGSRPPIPMLFPDEFIYGHSARSLAAGDGLTWRGDPVSLRAALYVFLITPAWLVSSGIDAYHLARGESAIMAALEVFPVWILAREFLTRRLALLATVLAVAGTWTLFTANLATENLAMPLATACLAATVLALRRPGSRLGWVALGFALLATWARLQVVVLVGVVLAAFVVDIVRAGPQRRERVAAHRPYLIATGVLVVAGLLVLLVAGGSSLGLYHEIADYRPSIGTVLRKTGLQLLGLLLLTGVLPVLCAFALALRRDAWRDPEIGPLLAVFWPAALAFALESGFYLAGTPAVTWGIERYVAYAMAPAIVLAVVAFRRTDLLTVRALAVGAAATLGLLLLPAVGDRGEQAAVWSTADRVDDVIGGSTAVACFVGALLVVGIALALRASRLRLRPASLALALGGLVGLVLVIQSATNWNWQIDTARAWRTNQPDDLRFVDHHSKGPVAVLGVMRNPVTFEQTDFFNDSITHYYVPASGYGYQRMLGGYCTWDIAADGTPTFDPKCGTPPKTFVVVDPAARLTFYDETSRAEDPKLGAVVSVAGKPAVRSVVILPCERPLLSFTRPEGKVIPADAPKACRPQVSTNLFLRAPGTLLLRFRGAPQLEHAVQINGTTYRIPPGRTTTVRQRVPAGASNVTALLDWAVSGADEPALTGVDLQQGATVGSLL